MGEPLVSVVVGVYNKARYVGETLKSVLGQTCPNWELIVVDDCSTDGSLTEVERAVGEGGRVQIIRRETNSGVCGMPREDVELLLRCAAKNFVGVVPEPLAKCRIRRDNWISRKWEGGGRDYLSWRYCYSNSELWAGVKNKNKMKGLLADIAEEMCQFWMVQAEKGGAV